MSTVNQNGKHQANGRKAKGARKTGKVKPAVPVLLSLVRAKDVLERLFGREFGVDDLFEVRKDPETGKNALMFRERFKTKDEVSFTEWYAVADLPEELDAHEVEGLEEYSNFSCGWWIGDRDVIAKVRSMDNIIKDARLALCGILESHNCQGINPV